MQNMCLAVGILTMSLDSVRQSLMHRRRAHRRTAGPDTTQQFLMHRRMAQIVRMCACVLADLLVALRLFLMSIIKIMLLTSRTLLVLSMSPQTIQSSRGVSQHMELLMTRLPQHTVQTSLKDQVYSGGSPSGP